MIYIWEPPWEIPAYITIFVHFRVFQATLTAELCNLGV